jgi:hypothetical protein
MARASALASGDSAAATTPLPASDAEASRQLAARARDDLRRLLDTVSEANLARASLLAHAYAAVGDTAGTMRWLDSMLLWRDPSLVTVPLHPAFDFLRANVRYRKWVSRLPWRETGKPGA